MQNQNPNIFSFRTMNIVFLIILGVTFGIISSGIGSIGQDLTVKDMDQDGILRIPEMAGSEPTFLSVWDTTNINTGSSNNNQIRLPLMASGTYNFTINWGDGITEQIITGNYSNAIHTYNSAGIYSISITGKIWGWQFNNGGDRLKLLKIYQWGPLQLGDFGRSFYGCSNLNLTATDSLNLTGITTLVGLFQDCTNLGSTGDMNGWDVSKVTNTAYMFYGAISFNQPISNWDVSSVTNMLYMFCNTTMFNQPIGNWNVSRVTDMDRIFSYATGFNQSIGNWNVSKVINMDSMFMSAISFNQPIGDWDVSSVTNMAQMFLGATVFNQPIGDWDVSSVTTMWGMFSGRIGFNQPIDAWNTSNVTNMGAMFRDTINFNQSIANWNTTQVTYMDHMFSKAAVFNQPLGDWDVSKVTTMEWMFYRAYSFNQPIGNWNVSQVTNMHKMFKNATKFNQPIDTWDVSRVTFMNYMFHNASLFNQPLGNWNVTSVTTMECMFWGAIAFDQPLGNWDVSNVAQMSQMFYDVTLSPENYDNLLIGWSNLSLQMNVQFSGGNSKYSANAVSARDKLIHEFSWSIMDGGLQQGGSGQIDGFAYFNAILIMFLGIGVIIISRNQRIIRNS